MVSYHDHDISSQSINVLDAFYYVSSVMKKHSTRKSAKIFFTVWLKAKWSNVIDVNDSLTFIGKLDRSINLIDNNITENDLLALLFTRCADLRH